MHPRADPSRMKRLRCRAGGLSVQPAVAFKDSLNACRAAIEVAPHRRCRVAVDCVGSGVDRKTARRRVVSEIDAGLEEGPSVGRWRRPSVASAISCTDSARRMYSVNAIPNTVRLSPNESYNVRLPTPIAVDRS